MKVLLYRIPAKNKEMRVLQYRLTLKTVRSSTADTPSEEKPRALQACAGGALVLWLQVFFKKDPLTYDNMLASNSTSLHVCIATRLMS